MILKAEINMNEIVALANKNRVSGQLKSTHVAFNESTKSVEMQ